MGDKTYYKMTFESWGFDWDKTEVFFSKTKTDAEMRQKEIEAVRGCRKRFYIEEVSFDEMKEEITVSDFEELFGVAINEPG